MTDIRLDNPYTLESGSHCGDDAVSGKWLRGNLHAHTTRSDGMHEPRQLIEAYAELGYDFLAVTDHDDVTSINELDCRGLILITGNEITSNGPHICHINTTKTIGPHWQRQRVLDRIIREEPNSFAIMNHPNWTHNYDHCPASLLLLLQGYTGIEVFNGLTNEEQGSGYAADKWDMVLATGRRVWAFANDDTHHFEDPGRAWNMVWAHEKSLPAIINALKAGRFYASSGVIIKAIRTTGTQIHIQTENAARIVAYTAGSRRIRTADQADMTLDVDSDIPFIRFECWGHGEQFAWSQPIFVLTT